LREALRERPWLVKLNEAEAGELLGRPVAGESAAVTAASDLLAGGAETTIVTRGVAGAVIARADVAWRVGPAPTQGRYAVGSGDVFLAGLAAGLLEGGEIVDAARLATGAAAANALIPGQGVFDARDARRMAEQVSVQRL
jgi:fructose-1-phosphate kinase PfkB-like protein